MLATKTDAKNQRTDYTYDAATQRLTREAVAGTATW
jgi:YD repeat-containing protein